MAKTEADDGPSMQDIRHAIAEMIAGSLYRRLVPEDRDSHLAPDGSISRINLDTTRELNFEWALTVVAERGHPEELAALASLGGENGVEEADARYEAFLKPRFGYVGEAKATTIEMLRTKAWLFAPVSPARAINAYARLLGLAKTDASALEEMAGLLGDSGDFPRAVKYFRELLGYEDLSTLTRFEATILLARALEGSGDLLGADEEYEKAYELLPTLEEADQNFWVPEVTECLARTAHARGDHKREAACYEAQRTFHDRYPEPLKDTLSLRETLRKLARVYQELGDPDQAEGHLQAALILAKEAEAPKAAAEILLELSRLSREGGRFREAEGHAQGALELGAGLKDTEVMGNARVELGRIAFLQGDEGKLRKHALQAIEDFKEAKAPLPTLSAYDLLSDSYSRTGELKTAAGLLEEARVFMDREGVPLGVAAALLLRSTIDQRLGDYQSAVNRLRWAQGIYSELGEEMLASEAHLRLGNIESGRGNKREAREHWETAYGIRTRLGEGDSEAAQDLRRVLRETA